MIYFLTGYAIDGPVNVQLLFPNKLPKNDIVALKQRYVGSIFLQIRVNHGTTTSSMQVKIGTVN